ncbi:hypothetical protein [Acinetobacter sp. TR3]|uniref:hypothetical protein n=1 Tax=Acinetobacter sp. TR3 TaxID=3003392 RepID=UPI0022ABE86D|nr:hypothetical protein [Acinetobacter sp. TR3]WAU77584.1 hypothetical protein O1449_05225 [Acinetobacter sp. TR3]
MKIIGLDRKTRDYLESLNIDLTYNEERFIAINALIKANIAFKTKLENFKQFIDCLSADRCFSLWIWETEELLAQSEETLRHFSQDYISEDSLIETHYKLAEKMCELTERVYEGHWEYGVSSAVDRQFDDLTELCRRIWSKENKAWVKLAKAWKSCNSRVI